VREMEEGWRHSSEKQLVACLINTLADQAASNS